jgi:hypothetical protein
MHENNAPANLWGFALRYCALILNYSPIRSNDWMSPHKLFFGEKPDYKCLYPFYCPGLYYVHKEERSKTAFPDYKAKSCYFLGYLEESPMSLVVKDARKGKVLIKDICVFDPELNKISKDVLDAIEDDDAEDEIKDDDQLVQIDDVSEPILSRLQDLRISTQNKHERIEKLAAEKSLAKRLHRKSSANSLSTSFTNFANDNHVPYARLFNVKYGTITKRPLLSNQEVWLSKVNEVLPL